MCACVSKVVSIASRTPLGSEPVRRTAYTYLSIMGPSELCRPRRLPVIASLWLCSCSCLSSCAYQLLAECDPRVGRLVQVVHTLVVLCKLLPCSGSLLQRRTVPLREHILPVFLCWLGGALHVRAMHHRVPYSFVLLSKSCGLLLNMLCDLAIDRRCCYTAGHFGGAAVIAGGLVCSGIASRRIDAGDRAPSSPQGLFYQTLSVVAAAALDATQQRIFARAPLPSPQPSPPSPPTTTTARVM